MGVKKNQKLPHKFAPGFFDQKKKSQKDKGKNTTCKTENRGGKTFSSITEKSRFCGVQGERTMVDTSKKKRAGLVWFGACGLGRKRC